MRFVATVVTVVFLIARSLAAEEPKPIEMTIRPRAIETPVLKYRLLPAEAELKPGDAAPILLRLPWERTQWMAEVFPRLDQWESRPLDAPEWANSDGVLSESIVSEMKRAAFRRDAHWEFPIGEAPLFNIRLSDVQGLGQFLRRGLAARIRYHLSRGELDEAREGILIGLANGRHLAQTPFSVVQHIASLIHQSMLDRTCELISQPGSPNLYWALSTLPDSLIEFDRTASLASDTFGMLLPAVNDLDHPRDEKEWRKMAEQLVELLRQDEELREQDQQQAAPPTSNVLAAWAKFARAELLELPGISQEKVAAMSDEEASVRWYVRQRQSIEQLAAAIVMLPPREVWPQFRFRKLQKRVRSFHEKAGTKESGYFDPDSIYVSSWALKRKIQSLRIIEAVRDYLAAHGGKLPTTLDEIKDVAIPLDPMTDAPFEWRVDGKTANLKSLPLPADAIEPNSFANRYRFLEYRLSVE